MIFSSYEFIFLFLPIVFCGYFLLNKFKFFSLAKVLLVLSSLIFYWFGSPQFTIVFIASIIGNYGCGKALNNFPQGLKKTFTLVTGILLNVLLLGYYKYTNFIITNVNYLGNKSFDALDIILPIGISFFTFQLIAYLVDSSQGKTGHYSFVDYLLFITFFPQLIVGPIVHHSDVVDQYHDIEKKCINIDNINRGLFLFSVGCFKKIFLADPLSSWGAEGVLGFESLSFIEAWFTSLSYTFAYYFDLSSYADMAIGLGLLFNINIPINFNSPYKATNFADYWKRWHMTLSRFLGDYLFRSIWKRVNHSKFWFYTCTFITFFVSGIWHGAGWNFVLWGIINGILVILSHTYLRSHFRLPIWICWPITFAFVNMLWILFVSPSIGTAFVFISKMFDFSNIQFSQLYYATPRQLIYLLVSFVIVLILPNTNQIMNKSFRHSFRYSIATCIFLFSAVLYMAEPADFLYFKF